MPKTDIESFTTVDYWEMNTWSHKTIFNLRAEMRSLPLLMKNEIPERILRKVNDLTQTLFRPLSSSVQFHKQTYKCSRIPQNS